MEQNSSYYDIFLKYYLVQYKIVCETQIHDLNDSHFFYWIMVKHHNSKMILMSVKNCHIDLNAEICSDSFKL